MTTRGRGLVRALVVAVLVLAGHVATSPTSTAAPAGSSGSSDWTAISAGFSHTCGIRDGGHLYCWGDNGNGRLGDGTTTDRTSPVEVVGGHADWIAVSSGAEHTCGRRASGRLYCWGRNSDGQLGDGTTTSRSVPTQVAGARTDWITISTGTAYTCALRASRRLYCWGFNGNRQLGDGTTTARAVPTQVAGARADWTRISAGNTHTCALRTSRRLYCWGQNADGELGDGTTTDRPAPTRVAGTVTDWVTVTVGGLHTCGLRASGRLLCWGNNLIGQVGDGSTATRTTPVPVSGASTGYTTVAAGILHTCALQSSGRLFCWGANGDSQLGDGTSFARAVPTAVAGSATDWRRVEPGNSHTCALTRTGRAYCWGLNDVGQVGDGTTTNRSTPTEVVVP